MMRRLSVVAAIAAGTVVLASRFQQDSPQRAAEQVMREVFDAHNRMQWGRIVLLLHPAAVTGIAQGVIAGAEAQQQARAAPPSARSDLPPCVAEYFDKQRAAHSVIEGAWIRRYGVSSLEELRRLNSEELAARALEASDTRTMSLEDIKRQKPALADSIKRISGDSVLLNQLVTTTRSVIGSIVENDSTILVIYRSRSTGSPEPEGTGVATVRRSGRSWRFWPPSEDLFVERSSSGWTGYAPAIVETQAAMKARASEIVTWDGKDVPAGRAFLAGFADNRERPVLVVEVGGEHVRLPRSVFQRVAELMAASWFAPER